jgi:hypothetical protein
MCRNLHIKGDGIWLYTALKHGSLVIDHDGLYMCESNHAACSGAAVLCCMVSGHFATVSLAKLTNESRASNYHGDLIGGALSSPHP